MRLRPTGTSVLHWAYKIIASFKAFHSGGGLYSLCINQNVLRLRSTEAIENQFVIKQNRFVSCFYWPIFFDTETDNIIVFH